MQLTDEDKKIAYSQGFLENWLELSKAPAAVIEQLKILESGVGRYRELAAAFEEDLVKLRNDYNKLTIQAANYLQFSQQQKDLIDQYEQEKTEE